MQQSGSAKSPVNRESKAKIIFHIKLGFHEFEIVLIRNIRNE